EGSGLPVEHIVVDLGSEGLPFDVTLVLANLTAVSSELLDHLRGLAAERPHRFIAVVPQESPEGDSAHQARERLDKLVASLRENGIVAAGMIGDPDPYIAAM